MCWAAGRRGDDGPTNATNLYKLTLWNLCCVAINTSLLFFFLFLAGGRGGGKGREEAGWDGGGKRGDYSLLQIFVTESSPFKHIKVIAAS